MSAPASAERSGAAPEDWTGLPTKAEVRAISRKVAQADRAASIAAYRAAHPEMNPAASDATVWALLELHAMGRGASAREAREASAGTDSSSTDGEGINA